MTLFNIHVQHRMPEGIEGPGEPVQLNESGVKQALTSIAYWGDAYNVTVTELVVPDLATPAPTVSTSATIIAALERDVQRLQDIATANGVTIVELQERNDRQMERLNSYTNNSYGTVIEEQQTQLVDQQRQLTDMAAQVNKAIAERDANRRKHEADITHIGEVMMQEADDRGWCNEYDTIVDRINRNLTVELPVRNKDYTVDIHYTVRFSVGVSARDADAAMDDARDLISSTIERLESSGYVADVSFDEIDYQLD
jgi:hypothetical protein